VVCTPVLAQLFFSFFSSIIIPSYLLCSPLLLKIALLREGLGIMTNNAAEYRALILGLNYASKKGFKYIRCQGDSKLVCNQVSCYFSAFVTSAVVHSKSSNSTKTLSVWRAGNFKWFFLMDFDLKVIFCSFSSPKESFYSNHLKYMAQSIRHNDRIRSHLY
jgi:hypothetical protein